MKMDNQSTGRNVSDLNKVLLTGRLVSDPEIKTSSQNQNDYCVMKIACNRNVPEYNGNGFKEEVCFIYVIVFKSAQACNSYLRKGSKIFLEGKLKHYTNTDDDGTRHHKYNIVADYVHFLDKKDRSNGDEVVPDNSSFGTDSEMLSDDIPF